MTPHEETPPPTGVTTTDRPMTLDVPSRRTLVSCSMRSALPSLPAVTLAPPSDCRVNEASDGVNV